MDGWGQLAESETGGDLNGLEASFHPSLQCVIEFDRSCMCPGAEDAASVARLQRYDVSFGVRMALFVFGLVTSACIVMSAP